jgi:D-alanyl-D-alanine dipeptidase
MPGDAEKDGSRVEAAQYWVDQMELGMAFVRRVYEHPVVEEGEPLIDIQAAARERGLQIVCSETPHVGGRPRIFRARAEVVTQLLAVAADLREIDHTLKIEDAFRSYEMQRDLAVSDEIANQVATAILLAEPDASLDSVIERLSVVVQTRAKSAGHMAGAAVDVSVLGPDGAPLDRGGPYVTVSEVMPMNSPFVSSEAAENRRFVSQAMERRGFFAYPFEFWHYSVDDGFARVAADNPAAARYGPVRLHPDGSVSPLERQHESMHMREDLERRLTEVLEKVRDAEGL